MSQVDLASILSLLSVLDTTLLIELTATTLYLYDYILTFSQEVGCVWNRKFTGASLLFIINRYVVLANRLVRLIQLVSWSGWKEGQADYVCAVVWRVSEVCTALMYLVIAGFSALRMYAIYNKSRRVLVIVLLMGLVNPCVSIYYSTALTIQAMPPPFRGCGQQSNFHNSTVDLILFLFGAVFSILTEAVVLALTWSRTADMFLVLRKLKQKIGLVEMLCRDGTIYFLVLLVLTCLSMLSIPDQSFNNVPALTDTLSSICLSRFMLNLRAIALSGGPRGSMATDFKSLSGAGLASCAVVGNLGAPVASSSRNSVPNVDENDDYEDRGQAKDGHDEDGAEFAHVSDDPLMTGISDDID